MSTPPITTEQKAALYDIIIAKEIIIREFPSIGKLNKISQDNLANFFVKQVGGGQDERLKTTIFVNQFKTLISMYEEAGHDIFDDCFFETYDSTFNNLIHYG